MNIKLNNGFTVKSTSLCFQLMKTKIRVEDSKAGKKGDEYQEKAGSYTSLESLFNGYLFHSSVESDVESIEQLIDLIKSIRDEIGQNYKINLNDL